LDPDEKRIIRGVLFLLVGILFNLYLYSYYIGFMRNISISVISMEFLAIAFILTGIFSIHPTKTQKGKVILALTSIIFGAVIFLLPLIDIFIQISDLDIAYQYLYLASSLLSISIYLIAGAIFLVHGLFMFRRNYTPGMLKRDI